eukprot:g4069.t1
MPLRRHHRSSSSTVQPFFSSGIKRKTSLYASDAERSELNPESAKLLRAQLAHIRKLPRQVFLTGSPGVRSLLALPPIQATNRFLEVVGQFQLVSALILSGAMQVAFEPIEVSELPQEKRSAAHAFNVTLAFLVFFSLLTCTTTCWVSQAIAGQTEDTVGTSLAKSIFGFAFAVEFPQYIQVILVEVAVLIAAFIKTPSSVFYIVLSGFITIHFGLIIIFFNWTGYAFPTTMIPWLSSQGLWFLIPKAESIEQTKEMIAQSILKNHGLSTEFEKNEEETKIEELDEELSKIITEVFSEEKKNVLNTLQANGMTLHVLQIISREDTATFLKVVEKVFANSSVEVKTGHIILLREKLVNNYSK